MCLIHLASKLRQKHKVFAVHINHGIRKASFNEEKEVFTFCESLDIPLISYKEKYTSNKN